MPFFSRVFRSRDASSKKQVKQNGIDHDAPKRPQWTDAWLRTEVSPEEVQELLHGCTIELKSRGLDVPFLLLPFRPSSDATAARTFVRNYFAPLLNNQSPISGDALLKELRLTEPMVLCSVMKWCWSRLPGGVVTWEAYELFKVGEQDSQLARDAFSTFIPISVESDARTKIIFDFFELIAAIAAHGKSNGLGGRKLSRYAGWWAFEHSDTGNGFEASYKNWANAADATSHLFFAYLRSLSPDSLRGTNGIATLPISLQTLVQATEYPPETPSLLQVDSTKVVMIVDTVSPTPFALLRRAKNFEYRDSDFTLQKFADYEDPVRALTDECRRVLRSIASVNQSASSTVKTSTNNRDNSWSRFEDFGFGETIEESDAENNVTQFGSSNGGLKTAPSSRNVDLGRPTTPSWADFLSSGFADENEKQTTAPLLLPPDKVLPPLQSVRGQSSQSHKRLFDTEAALEPGELASITSLDLDDSFWWVWITSLAGEEPTGRKAVFGRCALIETVIPNGKWLVLEEQVKGAAPEPEEGAYIAEKKSFFGFRTRNGRLTRRKSSAKKATLHEPYQRSQSTTPMSKTSIGPDQHARIQAAAAALQRKHREQELEQQAPRSPRGGHDKSAKTNSVSSMQPLIMSEASQAMKWASDYDKNAVRTAYLNNSLAGKGTPAESITKSTNGHPRSPSPQPPQPSSPVKERDLPPPPKEQSPAPKSPVVEKQPEPAKQAESSPKTLRRKPAPAADTPPEAPAPKSPEADKKPSESTEDHKKLKKKPGNTGLKGMFGKKKPDKADPTPVKSTGAEITSPVAAAKAAYENRTAKAAQQPPAPAKTPSRRMSAFEPKSPPREPSPVSKAPTPPPAEDPKPSEPVVQSAPLANEYDGPPRTRRDDEYDALSRIDTNERIQAEREFATFDHNGPFVDQPAFVPDDVPTTPTSRKNSSSPTTSALPSYSSEPTEARTSEHKRDESAFSNEPESQVQQDRWAQIRKNAAERAGQPEEPQPRMSQADRSDDGDTSGEETIESRVARIKARVAELTGNMEDAR